MTNRLTLVAVAAGSVVATLAAGGIALAATGHFPVGPLGGVDANGDGKVTRAEWITVANARFARLDANGDGSLAVGELPPPPRGHRRHDGPGRGGPDHGWNDRDGPDGLDSDADEAPAAAPVTPPAAAPTVAPATTARP